MAEILFFTGGQCCQECGEQIDPKRLKAQPDARKCIDCQLEREEEISRTLNGLDRTFTESQSATVTLRW